MPGARLARPVFARARLIGLLTFPTIRRLIQMRGIALITVIFAGAALIWPAAVWPQAGQLKTADSVLETGLLAGYRFQADDSSGAVMIVLLQDYKNFGGPLIATKVTSRNGDHRRIFTYTSVSYEALADSVFELPQAVKALLK